MAAKRPRAGDLVVGLGDGLIKASLQAYSRMLLALPEESRLTISGWDLMSKGPDLAEGWLRHDNAVLSMLIFMPGAHLARQNLEKKAFLREGLRRRLDCAKGSAIEATTTLARHLAAGYDSDTLFEQDSRGYSV